MTAIRIVFSPFASLEERIANRNSAEKAFSLLLACMAPKTHTHLGEGKRTGILKVTTWRRSFKQRLSIERCPLEREGGWLMSQMLQTVTLWLAWYREKEGLDEDLPGRPLRLKMLYASSRDEARLEAQQWLD